LQDTAADKRAKLIDRLLASPEHARHFAQVFDVVLLERRPDKHLPRPAWPDYLRESFAANKPWDRLVSEILTADGTDPKLRPAAPQRRRPPSAPGRPRPPPTRPPRAAPRLFLGMHLKCAQCHDHPLVDDYKQDDYYGLFAFYSRTSLFPDKAKGALLAEKGE